MSAVFITATGTDIGKTYVTAGLIRHFQRSGMAVDALKPVVTGFDPECADTSDPGVLLTALGRPVTPEEIARMSPWRFAAPVAPDLAAAREGRTLDFDALVAFSREAAQTRPGTLLIEGVGGIMVPLDERHTVLDWMRAIDAPVVLVAGSYLGTISHTLTCMDVLRRRDIPVAAIVINETAGATVGLADTLASVSRFAGSAPIFTLARGSNEFSKIAQRL